MEKLVDTLCETILYRWRLALAWGGFTLIALMLVPAPGGARNLWFLLVGVGIVPYHRLMRWIEKNYPDFSPFKTCGENPFAEPAPSLESIPIGTDVMNGQTVTLPLRNTIGLLLTGVPGCGKTALLQYMLSVFYRQGAQIKILDMKCSGDFNAFERGGVQVVSQLEKAVELLESAERELNQRLSWLKDTDGPKNYWNRESVNRYPLMIIAADEVQDLLEVGGVSKDEKELMLRAGKSLRALVKKGRSAGVFVIFSTQKADSTAIPTAIRDQFPVRISGRQNTAEAAKAAMGVLDEHAPRPNDKMICPPGLPGRFVVSGIGTEVIIMQGKHINEAELASFLGVLPMSPP